MFLDNKKWFLIIALILLSCEIRNEKVNSALIEIPKSGQVDGTTGTPLGGVGTGAVKYCAWTGIINAFTDMTPAGMQRYNKHVNLGKNASFQFYSNRNGEKLIQNPLKVPQINGHYDDDAVFPVHRAYYGNINDINISLVGFCPWDIDNFDRMTLPYAFFEFTLENKENTDAEASVAMNIKYEAVPVFEKGKGLRDESGMHKKAVYAMSSDKSSVISAGNDEGFEKKGECSNVVRDTVNKVAVKVKLKPKETKKIKFVLAWYKENKLGKYYYENLHTDAGSIAETGLIYFDSFKRNAESFVNRIRSSNIPLWMTNYVTNTLCNMVNNSVYAKDGRACMAEGEFNILGTIDEYWQGRNIIGSNMMPEFTWKELEYWGRTQFREPYLGQIHHDFGVKGSGTKDEDLCAWDDHTHPDYRPVEDVVSWPDENVGFIVGVYETFIATDDHKKLELLWPYVKNTAKRLLIQKDQYGDANIPWTFETSHNMYDAGGYCQTYSTGVVIPAYKCMALMAEIMNEPQTQQIYENAASETIKGFEVKYLSSPYKFLDKHCEGALAGPWFSQSLRFDQFDQQKTDKYIFNVLNEFYKPLQDSMGYPEGSYNEWPQHIVGHLGGYALQRGKYSEALALWKDMYNRSYTDRNRVFNLPISLQPKAIPNFSAEGVDGYLQYTSRTSTWRMYQDIVGYYRNKHTGEIWLEPIILPEMNHQLTNGFYISAEGNGTVSCTEKGETFEDRTIVFIPDNPIKITGIFIKDHTGNPVITIDDKEQTWVRTGPSWNRRIKIDYKNRIEKKGITIEVN